MPSIQIRIGASLGRDVASVYKPLVTAARAARAQIERELNGIKIEVGSTRGGPYRDIVAAARGADRDIITSARERRRTLAQLASEEERDAKRSAGERNRTVDSFARRTSYRTIHHVNAAVRGGIGLAADMGRAAGVDFSLGGMVGRAVGQEATAVNLANQGYMPGAQGENGQLQSSRTLLAGARSTAQTYARETDEILDATAKFVGLTGDLATARAIMGDLAKLSNATGSNLGDMASAAASVSTALEQGFAGSAAERMTMTSDVMHAIAGQGKVGAVEIKDLAAQMSKLAAASGQFAGKREDLLAFVGVMAQESRKAGGSASATQAATSILSFATNLSKPSKAQQKVMSQYGLDPYADKGKTQVKSPEEFIKEAIGKTKGNLQALGGIFSTAGSMRAVRGFANIYNQAGGGAKGMAAVDAEIATLKKASLDRAEVERANAAALETSKAKAIQFQNNVERVAASMADKVLPQLERLAPTILQVTDALGRFIGWASENPGSAVAAALGASIARAGIESTVRLGIDSAIKAGAAQVAAAKFTGMGGASGASVTAKILGTVAVAIVAWEAGKALIDWFAKEKGDQQNAADAKDIESENMLSTARAEIRTKGGLTEGTRSNLYQAFVGLGREVDRKTDEGSTNEVDKMNLERQVAVLEAMRQILAGGLTIKNLPGPGAPTVGAGRTGPTPAGAVQ